jgi:hypothetical protein
MATALCCYALARSGDQNSIKNCLDRLQGHILHVAGPLRSIWFDTGLPLCLGSIAYARGAYGEAQNYLAPIISNSQYAGGSISQNRLIRLTHLSTLIHNGYHVQAKHLLQTRLMGRDPTAFQTCLLSQCNS